MPQNVVVKGRDNIVTIVGTFSGDLYEHGFFTFNYIEIFIGNEIYNTQNDQEKFKVINKNVLQLSIGDVTNLSAGEYDFILIFYNAQFNDGLVEISENFVESKKIRVIEI